MELFLDTADARAVRELSEVLTVSGVTTNPTLIAKTGKRPEQVLGELGSALTPEQKLFVQVIATNSVEDMMQDVRRISGLRKNAYAKIPVTPVGLMTIKAAKAEGIRVLATAVYSADEAFLAAMNGADYLSPYVNRMCNLSDGIQHVRELQRMLTIHGLSARVCAASFKNTNQVHELILAGIEALTIPPDVVWNMVRHPSTQIAVNEFATAWETAFGRRTLV